MGGRPAPALLRDLSWVTSVTVLPLGPPLPALLFVPALGEEQRVRSEGGKARWAGNAGLQGGLGDGEEPRSGLKMATFKSYA